MIIITHERKKCKSFLAFSDKKMKDINFASDILRHYDLDHISTPYGNGHINCTYLVGTSPRFILQRINTDIFRDPDGVMENILAVTSFLRAKIVAAGGDPDARNADGCSDNRQPLLLSHPGRRLLPRVSLH